MADDVACDLSPHHSLPQRSVRLDQTALDTIEHKQALTEPHREPSESSWCQSSVGSASCSEGTTGSQEDVKQFLGLETRKTTKKKRRKHTKKSTTAATATDTHMADHIDDQSSDNSERMDLEALETANEAESAKKSIASIIRNARHARGSILMAKPDYRRRLTEWRRLEAEQNILNPDPEDQAIQGDQTCAISRPDSVVSSQLAAIGLLDEPRRDADMLPRPEAVLSHCPANDVRDEPLHDDVLPRPKSSPPVSSQLAATDLPDETPPSAEPTKLRLSPEKKAISVFLSLIQDTNPDLGAMSDENHCREQRGGGFDATKKRSVSAEKRSAHRRPPCKRHEKKTAPPKIEDEQTAFSIGYEEREKRRQGSKKPALEQPATVTCRLSSGCQAQSLNTAVVAHATSSTSVPGAHNVSVQQQQHIKSLSPVQSNQQPMVTKDAHQSVDEAVRPMGAPSSPATVDELPQRKLTTELSQKKLATELPQRKLATEPSQQKLAADLPQRQSATELSQRQSATELPQRQSVTKLSQRESATGELAIELTQREVATELTQRDLAAELPHRKLAPELSQRKLATVLPVVAQEQLKMEQGLDPVSSPTHVKPKRNKTARKRKQTKLPSPLPPQSSSAPATKQAAQAAVSELPKTFWDNVLVQDNNSVATEETRGEIASFDSAASVRNTTFVKEWGNLLAEPRHKVQIPAKIEEQADFGHDELPQQIGPRPPARRIEATPRPQKVPIAPSHFDMMSLEHEIAKPSRTSSPPRPPNHVLYPSLAAPHISTPALEPVFVAQRILSPRVPETTKDEEARDNYVRAMVRHKLIRRITPAAPGAFARKFGAARPPDRRKRSDTSVADQRLDQDQPTIPEKPPPESSRKSSYYLVWKYRTPLASPSEPRPITRLPTYVPRKPPSSAPASAPPCKASPRPKSKTCSPSATPRTEPKPTSEHAMRAFNTLAEAAARRALEYIRARQTKTRIARAARRLGVVPGAPPASPQPSRPPLTSLIPVRPIPLAKIATTVPKPFELSQSPRFDADSMRKQQELLWLAKHEYYGGAEGGFPAYSSSDDSSLRATTAQAITARRQIHPAGRSLEDYHASCLIHLNLCRRPPTQPMSPTRITMPSDYIDQEAQQRPASERARPERLSTAQLTRDEAAKMGLSPLVDPLLGQKGWSLVMPPTSMTEPAVVIVGAAKTLNEALRRAVVTNAPVCVVYLAETGLEAIQTFAKLAVLRVSIPVIFLGDVPDLSQEDLAFGLVTVANATALRDDAPMFVGFGSERVHQELVHQEGVHQSPSLLADFVALNDDQHLVTILHKALSRTCLANQPSTDIPLNNKTTPNTVSRTAISPSTAQKIWPARVHLDAHIQRASAPA